MEVSEGRRDSLWIPERCVQAPAVPASRGDRPPYPAAEFLKVIFLDLVGDRAVGEGAGSLAVKLGWARGAFGAGAGAGRVANDAFRGQKTEGGLWASLMSLSTFMR